MKLAKLFATLTVALLLANPGGAVTIKTVPIGNPGNPPDTRYDAGGFGSVPYAFGIGKFEVTNAQYVEFLNAVARSDPYELFDTHMALSTVGGIVREGDEGSYSYAVKPVAIGQGPGGSDYHYEDKPVVLVSRFDAIRFVNWLHNGEGSGSTETGAYTLLGETRIPSNSEAITRHPKARWWLPNEDEWYKAAYYNPATGDYVDFPTGSNIVPNNNLPANDTGNSANTYNEGYTTGSTDFPLTNVGAYIASKSPFGTFDQGGNAFEWTEAVLHPPFAGLRGSSWNDDVNSMHASLRFVGPSLLNDTIGFRVATVIPEPSTLLLGALGCMGLFLRRQRWMNRP